MIEDNLASVVAYFDKAIVGLLYPQDFLKEAGVIAKEGIEHRIKSTKTDPDENAWAAWMEPTEIHRMRKGTAGQGLLFDSGKLLDSFEATMSASSVSIGTSVDYAGFLQQGTNKMTARPFVGWGNEDQQRVGAAFYEWVHKRIG